MKALPIGAMVGVMTLAAVTISGCSAGGGSDPDTLTVLTNIQPGTLTGDVQDDVVAKFEEKTGKKVKLVPAGETMPDVYETSVAGGKEADIVVVNLAEKTTNWLEQDIVVPASDYLDDWGLTDRINPEALEAWTNEDGVVQAFPYNGFVWPVWYNTALLEQAGITDIPTTTDQLIDAAGRLETAGISPFIVGGNDWSGQKLFLQIAQSFMDSDEAAKVYSEGGYCASEDALKGIELFAELRDAGVFVKDSQGYTADQMNATFYEGKAAMMAAGSWAFSNVPAELQDSVELGGFPIPDDSSFEKPTAYEGYTGSGFWISQNGAKDDKIGLVEEYIKLWYEPEFAAAYAQASNAPTAVIAEGEAPVIENKVTEQAVNTLPDKVEFAVMPDTVVPGALADPMIRQTSAAYAPGTDAQAICGSLDGLYTN